MPLAGLSISIRLVSFELNDRLAGVAQVADALSQRSSGPSSIATPSAGVVTSRIPDPASAAYEERPRPDVGTIHQIPLFSRVLRETRILRPQRSEECLGATLDAAASADEPIDIREKGCQLVE